MLQQKQSFEQPDDIVLHIAGKKITPGKGKYSLKGKGTPGPVVAKLFREAAEKGIFKDSFEARMKSEERREKKLRELSYDYEEL
jgi:hypothetical protein